MATVAFRPHPVIRAKEASGCFSVLLTVGVIRMANFCLFFFPQLHFHSEMRTKNASIFADIFFIRAFPHGISTKLINSSSLRLRAAAITRLAMLLAFAGLSLVCTQLPAQQSAAVALNEPVRAQNGALKDSDLVPRWSAVTALNASPDPRSVPVLVEALKDSDAAVRAGTASVLGDIGPDAKAAVPALVEALKDSDWWVRASAAGALGYIGPDAKAAVPALVGVLKDSDAGVRVSAAFALSRFGPDAVPALVETLKDSDANVRAAAAEGLIHIGPDAKAAVPALVETLKDSNSYVRGAAAGALGGIGPGAKAAVPALVEALKDSDANVREVAAHALIRIAPDAKAAASARLELLKHSNARIRQLKAAVEASSFGVGPDAKAAVPALGEAP